MEKIHQMEQGLLYYNLLLNSNYYQTLKNELKYLDCFLSTNLLVIPRPIK